MAAVRNRKLPARLLARFELACAALLLLAASLFAQEQKQAAPPTLTPAEAKDHVGKQATVCGRVYDTIQFFCLTRYKHCESVAVRLGELHKRFAGVKPTQPHFYFVYLLYVDESGDGGLAAGSSKHLVLAGAAMHEGQWKSLNSAVDTVQHKHFPQAGSPVEFHASEIRNRRKAFGRMLPAQRNQIMGDVYGIISNHGRGLVLFAAVIDKPALMYKYQGKVDPYERAFEGLCTMFNFFLQRMQRRTGAVLRGIVVFDEARPSLTKHIRSLLAQFQAGGTRWAQMTNLIETAFFFDSRTSRLMQISDFSAYAVYRWYEANDDTYLRLIHHKLDRVGQKIHGLKCYPLESTKTWPPKKTP